MGRVWSIITGVAALIALQLSVVPAEGVMTTEVSRNGDFSAGGDQWVVSPSIPPSFALFAGGAAALHPSSQFSGTVIHQNLNVFGIGGSAVLLNCTMSKVSAPTGRSIAYYVDYIDTATGSDLLVTGKLATPLNDDITSNTQVSGSFPLPATARKLVKFRVVKEGYGDFSVDNISLRLVGVPTIAPVPIITSLSADSGAYGGSLTITGTGFGATTGTVTVGGSSAGVAVTAWSDTSVTIALSDPARSGAVMVVRDFTESNLGPTFSITSPNYTFVPKETTVTKVKGEFAEFLFDVKLLQGYTTTGIIFGASGLPGGTVSTFYSPSTVVSGGTVLRIATGTLSPGSYPFTVTATATGMATRSVPAILRITSTDPASIVFNYSDGTNPSTPVTSMTVTGQKQLVIVPTALDTDGRTITGLTLSSSGPAVGAYRNSMGFYDIYTHQTGSADLTVTTPDGVTKKLPFTVTVPDDNNISIGLMPMTITNTYAGDVSLSTLVTLTSPNWYSVGREGMLVLSEDKLDFGNSSSSPYFYGGSFKINQDQTQLGTYLFYGNITNGFGGGTLYKNAVPLTIVNDPATYSGMHIAVRTVDPTIVPMMYEHYRIEFYTPADSATPVKEIMNFDYAMTPEKISFIGAIPPGSYRIKLNPLTPDLLPMWYPNADSHATAQTVSFTAGVTAGPLYFFARKAPDTTPPYITGFSVPATASALTVTGITLSAWDSNGITGYCLTEVNDAAGCVWSDTPPTQYVFATPGAKTLYAFAKDTSGNVSITDTTSTQTVTITIQYTLTVTISGTGSGSVNSTPSGIACATGSSANCSAPFDSGSSVALSRLASTFSTFSGWSGACTGTGTCNPTMSGPLSVTATFAADPPRVKIDGLTTSYYLIDPTLDLMAKAGIVLAKAEIFAENVTMTSPVAIQLKGGYTDAGFSLRDAASRSVIDGSLKIRSGLLRPERIAIR